MKNGNQFHSKDMYLTSAVALLSGLNPKCVVDEFGKVIFVFPNDGAVQESIIRYHDGATSPLIDYVDRLRSIRAAMFAAKGGAR